MKRPRKECLACILSLAALALLLAFFTVLLTPKQHDHGAGWGQFRQEAEQSIDVLVVGSSMAYCDVVPAVFWEETGLTAYVMGGQELPFPMEEVYLREALRTQRPRAVLFEVTSAFWEPRTGHEKLNIGQMPWGWNRWKATFTQAGPEERLGLLFPLYFYHDRWDSLTGDDWSVALRGYEAVFREFKLFALHVVVPADDIRLCKSVCPVEVPDVLVHHVVVHPAADRVASVDYVLYPGVLKDGAYHRYGGHTVLSYMRIGEEHECLRKDHFRHYLIDPAVLLFDRFRKIRRECFSCILRRKPVVYRAVPPFRFSVSLGFFSQFPSQTASTAWGSSSLSAVCAASPLPLRQMTSMSGPNSLSTCRHAPQGQQ